MSDVALFLGDCKEVLKGIESESVDLTVTSPPYDNLRKYNGYAWDFDKIARELFRVTKSGGVVVWVVADTTKNCGESLTSFKQALFFQSLGFAVETMIYKKIAVASKGSKYLYEQSFEYMFVMTKGKKPATCNLIRDKRNKYFGSSTRPKRVLKDGTRIDEGLKTIRQFSKRHNVWEYGGGDRVHTGHPAVFPEGLVKDHILSWSKEGDLVLDPFMGSGTTGKMAKLLNRDFIGIDVSQEYLELASKRIEEARLEFV